jgi:glyoxylase-like metal-dependent hydrolase (beta-lactamase superfamily II)
MKITTFEAGFFYVDGGAMFGVVPKRVWQKRYPCNDQNMCKLAMRLMLVETDSRLILMDTGVGEKQLEYLKYYDFTDVFNLEDALKSHGYAMEQVTDVVLTHLHFDHCGGTTRFVNDQHDIGLTFPNAWVWVGKSQWENFLHPNVREGDSYFAENMLPVFESGKLKCVDQSLFIDPNVELKIFNGHTSGQLVPYVYLNDHTTLVYVGDVIPVAAAIPIAWVSAYDTFPITSMEDKETLLSEAVEKQQILCFEHDAYIESCRVQKVNGKYRMTENGALMELLKN